MGAINLVSTNAQMSSVPPELSGLCKNSGIKKVIMYKAMEFMPPAINAATYRRNLFNLPLVILAICLALRLLPKDAIGNHGRLDFIGM